MTFKTEQTDEIIIPDCETQRNKQTVKYSLDDLSRNSILNVEMEPSDLCKYSVYAGGISFWVWDQNQYKRVMRPVFEPGLPQQP